MKATSILLLAVLVCVNAQEYCGGNTFAYLSSTNISASSVANKPLVITANDGIVVNVKFVVVDAPIDSSIQVTLIGQGTSYTTASTVGSKVDTSNGLSITISKVNGVVSASATTQSSILVLLPVLFLSFFFGKRAMAVFLVLSFVLYMAHAANPCVAGQAGATLVVSIPNNFAFSTTTYNVNGGSLECDASPGLFAPLCNSIVTSAIIPNTLGPYTATQGYTVQWLAGGIYAVWDSTGLYNTIFVVTDSGVIVVDAPPTLGASQIDAIKSVTNQPVKYFVYSHYHTDHVGSSNIWANTTDLQVVGHQEVYNAIALSNSPIGAGRLLPTITFQNNYTLTLGNETLLLSNFGIFHSPGDIVIYSAAHKIVQVVDVFSKSFGPFRRLFETIYTQGFMKAHDLILTYDFDTVVGGHINLVARSDVERSKTLVMALRQAAIDALTTIGYPNTGVDKNGASNPWLTFEVYLARVAEVCVENFRTNNAVFFTQYSALDVFMYDHCDNMINSMRLE